MAISGHHLLRLRRTSRRLRSQNIEVWRATDSRTTGGGTTQVRARVLSLVGRLAGGGEMERNILDRLGISNGKVVTLETTTDIRIDDWLKTGGKTYEVVGFTSPQSKRINQRVVVREASGNS